MWVYDLMAMFKNVRLHRILNAGQAASMEPILAREGLQGAAVYYECLEDDSRLTLATILAAHAAGAVVANHAEVRSLINADGIVCGAQVRDRLSGQDFSVRARVVVNATSVWADKVRQLDDADATSITCANRGTHVIVAHDRLPIQGVVLFSSADGRRTMYALRWKNTTIVGTTDEDHLHDLDQVYATGDEVAIMVDSVNDAFPSARLTYADIVSTYAGLRPLIDEDNNSAYQASRDHRIYDSPSELVSITGGKLTTHRKMAEDLLDYIARRLEQTTGGAKNRVVRRTDHVPLVHLTFDAEAAVHALRQQHPNLPEDVLTHLCEAYGADATSLVVSIIAEPALGERISPDLAYVYAEVPYAVQHEMALTLNDFLIRRTHMIHEAADQGLSCADRVAAVIGDLLHWNQDEIQAQGTAYRQEVEFSRRYRQELGLDDVIKADHAP